MNFYSKQTKNTFVCLLLVDNSIIIFKTSAIIDKKKAPKLMDASALNDVNFCLPMGVATPWDLIISNTQNRHPMLLTFNLNQVLRTIFTSFFHYSSLDLCRF